MKQVKYYLQAHGDVPQAVISAPPSSPGCRYQVGQQVRHAKFGKGLVVSSKARGADEEVEVAFASAGLKCLSAKLANLVIL